ncbi:MAG: 6-pyruvoyl-tetrahydropterin synthase-related protein [Caldilineaceae bacterium]|nr:6-pyruvoyl-tetrahydropterin synthase-related protein [Caldilineaceae bacterium]
MPHRLPVNLSAILFIALLALLISGPFWQQSGLPANAIDQLQHVHRMAAMERSFEQGVYWPRWFPAVYNGLGAPVFHHYAPGLYWLVAAVHRTGIGLDQALKLVVTVALLLAGFGAYGWLRYAFSPVASLVGAGLFLLHPHILTRSYYYVGAYPRLLALLLLPVCLWAFTSLHARSRIRNWLAAVLSLTALVLSHTLLTMIGAAVLAFYWLLLAIGYRRPSGLLRCALAAMLAALLSAGFWLPALADLNLVSIEGARIGPFHYSIHFLDLWQLFSFPPIVLDSRAGNPLMPLNTLGFGAVSWAVLLGGLVSLFFVSRRERRYWGLAGVLFAISMIMLTLQISEPLWERIPGLSMVQFPFRFLSIAPLGILPAAAVAVDAFPNLRRWLPALALVIASFLALFPYLFPAHTSLSPNVEVRSLSAEDTRSFEQTSFAWGTTVSGEFLPRGADMNVINGQTPEPSAAQPQWRSPHEAAVDLSNQHEPILIRLHFHPGWDTGDRATLAAGPAGWVQVNELRDLGQPLVILWKGTDTQRWGERASLFGLTASVAGLLFLVLRRRGRKEFASESRRPEGKSSFQVNALAGCALCLVLVRLAFDQSDSGPYLRHSPPGQLAFAVEGLPATIGDSPTNQVTLLGWQLVSGGDPKPGGTIRARLYWQANGKAAEELHSFLHLYTPSMQRSWAVQNVGIGGRPDSQFWDPAKYYVDDLRLSLPADLPPVTYSLVAGMFTSHGERIIVPGSNDNTIHLRTVEVVPLRPGIFQREKPGIITPATTDDGLRLQGYDLFSQPGVPSLRLFWETGDGIRSDWITYVHMHDEHGERVAQFDGPAIAGLQPTSQWRAKALYIDRRELPLPAELLPGKYLLRIGLYDRSSGERLALQSEKESSSTFEGGQLLVPLSIQPRISGSE